MSGNMEYDGGRRLSHWRIAAWAAAAFILLLPLVAMQFTDEVNWNAFDFVVAGALLLGAGFAVELVVRQVDNRAYRLAACMALAGALILVWVNMAVGIIGSEDEAANLMYFAVLAVGAIGAFLARFRPRGMARALFAMALAQALAAVIALIARWGATGPNWRLEIIVLNGFFVVLFAGSALLFQKAAQERSALGARSAG